MGLAPSEAKTRDDMRECGVPSRRSASRRLDPSLTQTQKSRPRASHPREADRDDAKPFRTWLRALQELGTATAIGRIRQQL
jgi:hypothetical protein